jgi:hypothetical protein
MVLRTTRNGHAGFGVLICRHLSLKISWRIPFLARFGSLTDSFTHKIIEMYSNPEPQTLDLAQRFVTAANAKIVFHITQNERNDNGYRAVAVPSSVHIISFHGLSILSIVPLSS